MTEEQKFSLIYNTAKKYLYEIKPAAITDEEMEKEYFDIKKFSSMADILKRMLSALSEHSYASIINYNKRKDAFQEIFFNYDIYEIIKSYTPETLISRFEEMLSLNVQRPNSIFAKYAKTAINACEFLSDFADEKAFDKYVQQYLSSVDEKIKLANLLASKIYNCGFTLACNCLKDLGYTGFAKPDTHLISIFHAFSLCENKPESVFRAILKMADIVGDTPFNIDRIFWLIGSSYFYKHEMKIGIKDVFIDRARGQINE